MCIRDRDQAVVVAKADQRGDRKTQHLVGRARPDAADHRQEVPVAEGRPEAFAVEEVTDGLGQLGFGATLGQCSGQPIEAQDLRQHAPEAVSYTHLDVYKRQVLRNEGAETISVGLRALFDVKLDTNDGSPYFIPGQGTVAHEREFLGGDVPDYWLAFASPVSYTHLDVYKRQV